MYVYMKKESYIRKHFLNVHFFVKANFMPRADFINTEIKSCNGKSTLTLHWICGKLGWVTHHKADLSVSEMGPQLHKIILFCETTIPKN